MESDSLYVGRDCKRVSPRGSRSNIIIGLNSKSKGARSPSALQRTKGKAIGGLEYGREEVTSLSQLSDLSVAAEQTPMLLNSHSFLGLDRLSQDAFAEPAIPSQPDIPAPDIRVSGHDSLRQASPFRPTSRQPSKLGQITSSSVKFSKAGQPENNAQAAAPQKTKATRRGPMDEMRQLVRILVKIIPQSVKFISIADEGGGGNRISEDQIKSYLDNTMGDAPRPQWGVPQGWGKYLAGAAPSSRICPCLSSSAMLSTLATLNSHQNIRVPTPMG